AAGPERSDSPAPTPLPPQSSIQAPEAPVESETGGRGETAAGLVLVIPPPSQPATPDPPPVPEVPAGAPGSSGLAEAPGEDEDGEVRSPGKTGGDDIHPPPTWVHGTDDESQPGPEWQQGWGHPWTHQDGHRWTHRESHPTGHRGGPDRRDR
ncbi:MAG: hypothetical protein WBP61_08420, partial [Nocardioides sp.]